MLAGRQQLFAASIEATERDAQALRRISGVQAGLLSFERVDAEGGVAIIFIEERERTEDASLVG